MNIENAQIEYFEYKFNFEVPTDPGLFEKVYDTTTMNLFEDYYKVLTRSFLHISFRKMASLRFGTKSNSSTSTDLTTAKRRLLSRLNSTKS